jgi:acetoin utilization protein AcuC
MYDFVIAHTPEFANWVFNEKHPTQGRRFVHAYNRIQEYGSNQNLNFTTIYPQNATFDDLMISHSKQYVDQVLLQHECNEWVGKRPDLSNIASLMVGASMAGLRSLIDGATLTAINFAGAKHHAAYDHSSGFGVFNDFAICANIASKDYDMKVAILDVDAHHGDGTEDLVATLPNVMHYSIHEWGIFPGTGLQSEPIYDTYNFPLDYQAGNDALYRGVDNFLHIAHKFNPDILFVTLGADGHVTDPLSSLRYTINGFQSALAEVRTQFPKTPILIGGAGGYQPDDFTPEMWSRGALSLVSGKVEKVSEYDTWAQSLTL